MGLIDEDVMRIAEILRLQEWCETKKMLIIQDEILRTRNYHRNLRLLLLTMTIVGISIIVVSRWAPIYG